MPKTTNPCKFNLALYRLEPLHSMLEREEWMASTIKETCWVQATSEQEARAMVEVETRTPQSHAPVTLPFFSPWSSSSFTSCTREDDGAVSPYPAGAVYTRDGLVKEASGSSADQHPAGENDARP
jgi:hypothetical protein